MPSLNQTIDRSLTISRTVSSLLERRMQDAGTACTDRLRRAQSAFVQAGVPGNGANPQQLWQDWWQYGVDFAQRSVLFWDTLRERGNNWIAHEQAGKPPLLAYEYEVISDGR
ncbi:MAG: DUF3141 domain-containing protein, partial [Casimicrobiaceae bacterium]